MPRPNCQSLLHSVVCCCECALDARDRAPYVPTDKCAMLVACSTASIMS